jgi:hypothetical protein
VALVCAPAAVAVAQDYTPEEQAEIDADARDVPVPMSQPEPETITCSSGMPTVLYFSDFESDDGGWTVTTTYAEWEHGAISQGVFDQCDSTDHDGPAGAYSGSNAWATNLDGCYANAGDDTILAQTFDLTSLTPGTEVQLEWWHWYHVFESFDYAQAFVDGVEVWRTPGSNPSADWELVTVDISAHAGSTVEVEFLLHSTTVVNRPGWYIDDVEISYCQAGTPVERGIPTLSTAGIAAFLMLIAAGAFIVLRRRG